MSHGARGSTRECWIDQLHPELLKLSRQYISNNDQIVACFESKVEWFDKGLLGESIKSVTFSAEICTHNRIISVRCSPGSYYLQWNGESSTMELEAVESIREMQSESAWSRGMRNSSHEYSIEFTGRGGAEGRLVYYSPEACSKFATTLRDAVARAKTKTSLPVSASPNSVEGRILALKQLRQDGLITEAQFQHKIQEIVNQL